MTEGDPYAGMQRKIAWDMLSHRVDMRAVQAGLGLVPDSADGLRHGHVESDRRLLIAQPLNSHVAKMCDLACKVISYTFRSTIAACADDEDEDGLPEEFLDSLDTQNVEVVTPCVMAVVTSLIDDGILAYGPHAKDWLR